MKRAVLLLLLLASGVAAQPISLLPSEGPVNFEPGESQEITFRLIASEPDPVNVLLRVEIDGNWIATVQPEQIVMAGGEATIQVEVTAARIANPRVAELRLEAILVNGTFVDRTSGTHGVEWHPTRLVLGTYDNPLPAPADGTGGTFVLNVLAWTAVAAVAVWVIRPLVKIATRKTESTTDDKLARAFTVPAFLLTFAYGFKQSLESLTLWSWTYTALDRMWTVVLAFAVTYLIYHLWHQVILVMARRISKNTESDLDDRLYPLFDKVGGVIIVLGGFFAVIKALGYNVAYFAAGGVAASLVIAFAAQDTLSNFFSGIHILIDRPFKEGEDIKLESGEVCRVDRIGLRSTRLYHRANHEHFICPNNLLANTRIINMVHPDTHYKINIPVGVAYGSDVKLVKKLLLEAAAENPLVMKDEDHSAWVWFLEFGESSLDFKLFVWVEDLYARWAVGSDLREVIDAKFRQNGVEIPFPQRVMWQGKETEHEIAETPTPDHQTLEQATAMPGDD